MFYWLLLVFIDKRNGLFEFVWNIVYGDISYFFVFDLVGSKVLSVKINFIFFFVGGVVNLN